MIGPSPYICDTPGCGQVRSATNHWLAVQVEKGGVYIFTWDQAVEGGRLERCSHFCGSNHALQFVSSEMGKEGK